MTFAEALSAWGTAASAAFAGVQIALSRRDANRRAAIEQIRAVGTLREAYAPFADDDPAPGILRRYRGEAKDVTSGARAYLALLNRLDLVAFGIQRGMIDRATALDYLKTVLRGRVVGLSFLRELQGCCGDPCIYEHLAAVLVDLEQRRRNTRPSTPLSPVIDAQREAPRAVPAAASPTAAATPAPTSPSTGPAAAG